jgi:hypothetical protein
MLWTKSDAARPILAGVTLTEHVSKLIPTGVLVKNCYILSLMYILCLTQVIVRKPFFHFSKRVQNQTQTGFS